MIIKCEQSELLADLEVSYYEYLSYQNMINSLRKNNQYDENYWDMWSQYMEVTAEYETLKEHLNAEIIIPITDKKSCNWNVNFETNEIYIEFTDDNE